MRELIHNVLAALWSCLLWALVVAMLLWTGVARGQGPEHLALADLQAQPDFLRPFIRYVAIEPLGKNAGPLMPDSSGKAPVAKDDRDRRAQSAALAAKMLSRSTLIGPEYRPLPLKDTKGNFLLRIDIRHYAPTERDLLEWHDTWELLQFDPRFSLLITEGSLKLASELLPTWEGRIVRREQVLIEVPAFTQGGKEFTKKWAWKTIVAKGVLTVADIKDVQLVKIIPPHVDAHAWETLVAMTGSQAPVVSYRYFIGRGLQAIQEQGIYQQIYGGLYYQFVGIKTGAKSDEDVLLDELGIANLKGGLTAEKVYANLKSHQRVAMSRSGVTSRPRRIDFLRIPEGARLDSGIGLFSITQDLKKQSIDIDVHPLANLLKSKADGKEAIFEAPNGLHRYVLFNGDGKRVDEVPPDIATDHTVPSPYGTRLQPAISCIACHEAAGSDGWIVAPNHVKSLSRIGVLPVADLFFLRTTKALSADDAFRLAYLYQGESEGFFSRGRDDYAAAVLKATGPWPGSQSASADVVLLATRQLVGDWREYFEAPVDYLGELGVKREELRKLLPDIKTAHAAWASGQVILEDFRTGLMLADLPLERPDFDLNYSYIMARLLKVKGAKK